MANFQGSESSKLVGEIKTPHTAPTAKPIAMILARRAVEANERVARRSTIVNPIAAQPRVQSLNALPTTTSVTICDTSHAPRR